ncbi:MAG: tetratricopeptide repeat protein, partial [Deltaproteobacteria bacterium]|nr:tetratricopeptide repeat protein [Deltaproteobacteria bacterium]
MSAPTNLKNYVTPPYVTLEVGNRTSNNAFGMASWCLGIGFLVVTSGLLALQGINALADETQVGAKTAAAARPADKASAKVAFEAAKKAYAEKRYAEAASLFSYSYDLSGNPDLLFNVAQALRLSGDLKKALATYRLFLKERPDSENARLAQIKIDEIDIALLPVPSRKRAAREDQAASIPVPALETHLVFEDPPVQRQRTLPTWALKAGAITTGTFAFAAIATGLSASSKFSDLKDSCGQTPQGCT